MLAWGVRVGSTRSQLGRAWLRMASIPGSELGEWYGEELRGYRDEGLSWWAAREALYEAHPKLKGRVGDHAMRQWYGGREHVQKKPAGAARRYGLNDLGRLWDWGLAKVSGDLNVTYRKLQRGLLMSPRSHAKAVT